MQHSWGSCPDRVSQTGPETPGEGAVLIQKEGGFPGFVRGFLGTQMRKGEGAKTDARGSKRDKYKEKFSLVIQLSPLH